MYSGEKIIGGKSGRDTPGTMPNPEVKPASVDGTVRGTHGRADHCQFRFYIGSLFSWDFLFLFYIYFFLPVPSMPNFLSSSKLSPGFVKYPSLTVSGSPIFNKSLTLTKL